MALYVLIMFSNFMTLFDHWTPISLKKGLTALHSVTVRNT